MKLRQRKFEAPGQYFNTCSLQFKNLENNDYFVHVDTFYYYYSRCLSSSYPVIKRMIGDSENIALGIVTNFRSKVSVRNNLPEPVQINKFKRFPYDGKYINLSRGYIHDQIKRLIKILETNLKCRESLRSRWMATSQVAPVAPSIKEQIEATNAISHEILKSSLDDQDAAVGPVLRSIQDALDNTHSYKAVCNREEFEEDLGLVWVFKEDEDTYFGLGYF